MGFKLEHIEPGIVTVTFFGSAGISERMDALDEVNAIRDASEGTTVLIDLSKADMRHYSAVHALAFSDAVSRRNRPSKVAYVLRPDQADMVATAMSGLHGPKMFRRFLTREAAVVWLRGLGEESPANEA